MVMVTNPIQSLSSGSIQRQPTRSPVARTLTKSPNQSSLCKVVSCLITVPSPEPSPSKASELAAASKKMNMSKNIFESLAEDVEVKVKNPGQKFVENSKIQLFLLIVTFYALFADDYRTLVTKPDMDINFDIFVWICIAIFMIEIFISTISKSGYFNSYYFYLDIISTASLILDFSPVRNALNEFG